MSARTVFHSTQVSSTSNNNTLRGEDDRHLSVGRDIGTPDLCVGQCIIHEALTESFMDVGWMVKSLQGLSSLFSDTKNLSGGP